MISFEYIQEATIHSENDSQQNYKPLSPQRETSISPVASALMSQTKQSLKLCTRGTALKLWHSRATLKTILESRLKNKVQVAFFSECKQVCSKTSNGPSVPFQHSDEYTNNLDRSPPKPSIYSPIKPMSSTICSS